MQHIDRFGGGSVMVLTSIHHGGRTALVHAARVLMGIRYRNEILQHHVILHMNVNGEVLQHDNARPDITLTSFNSYDCYFARISTKNMKRKYDRKSSPLFRF